MIARRPCIYPTNPSLDSKGKGSPGEIVSDNQRALLALTLAPADTLVFFGDIFVRVLCHEQGSDKSDQCTDGDVDGDGGAGLVHRKEPGGDDRCWTAGDDRSELVPDRGSAVSHPRCELLGNQRSLGSVDNGMRNGSEDDSEHDQRRVAGIE